MQDALDNTPTQDASKQTRYVRVTGTRMNRFVEFDFSIGDPNLFVELILPFDQFKKFCKQHQAQDLTDEQKAQVDLESMKWRYGQPDSPIVSN
jgi:phenol hydroxylase P0 protein